jgi:hypothetical protein
MTNNATIGMQSYLISLPMNNVFFMEVGQPIKDLSCICRDMSISQAVLLIQRCK